MTIISALLVAGYFSFIVFIATQIINSKLKPEEIAVNVISEVPKLKTVKDVLEYHLTEAPVGCMWQVEKTTTHYRKLPTGRMVFDGAYGGAVAKVTLITPKGSFKSFKVTIGDEGNWLSQFSTELGQERIKVLNAYSRSIDNWDGIYMKDVL